MLAQAKDFCLRALEVVVSREATVRGQLLPGGGRGKDGPGGSTAPDAFIFASCAGYARPSPAALHWGGGESVNVGRVRGETHSCVVCSLRRTGAGGPCAEPEAWYRDGEEDEAALGLSSVEGQRASFGRTAFPRQSTPYLTRESGRRSTKELICWRRRFAKPSQRSKYGFAPNLCGRKPHRPWTSSRAVSRCPGCDCGNEGGRVVHGKRARGRQGARRVLTAASASGEGRGNEEQLLGKETLLTTELRGTREWREGKDKRRKVSDGAGVSDS